MSKLPRKFNSKISKAIVAALHEKKRIENKLKLDNLIAVSNLNRPSTTQELTTERTPSDEEKTEQDNEADILQLLINPEDTLQ